MVPTFFGGGLPVTAQKANVPCFDCSLGLLLEGWSPKTGDKYCFWSQGHSVDLLVLCWDVLSRLLYNSPIFQNLNFVVDFSSQIRGAYWHYRKLFRIGGSSVLEPLDIWIKYVRNPFLRLGEVRRNLFLYKLSFKNLASIIYLARWFQRLFDYYYYLGKWSKFTSVFLKQVANHL